MGESWKALEFPTLQSGSAALKVMLTIHWKVISTVLLKTQAVPLGVFDTEGYFETELQGLFFGRGSEV